MTTLTPAGETLESSEVTSGGGSRRVQIGAAWIMASNLALSGLNYLYTICLMWWLPDHSYAVAASASALLLVCGSVATASAPWVLAQELAAGRDDAERRRGAVSFCIAANLIQGAIGAAATVTIASHYADGLVLGAIAVASIMIFAAATAIGYLQGFERFQLIAALRLAEVVIKVGTGLVLIRLGAGAGGVLAGYAIGATVVAGVGIAVMAPDLRLRFAAVKDRALWARARGVLSIQVGVAVLASADIVLGSLLIPNVRTLATYQVSLVVARIPLVLAGAISIAAFSRLSALRRHDQISDQLRGSFTLFLKVTIPAVLIVATLPSAFTATIFSPAYRNDVGVLLPWTAVAGGLIGAVQLLTTSFQAQTHFRRPVKLLGLGLACHFAVLIIGIKIAGTTGLAIGSVIGGSVVVGLLLRETRALWAGSLQGLVPALIWAVATAAPLVFLRGSTLLWLVWLALGVCPTIAFSVLRRTTMTDRPTQARLRVLHFAFEDPRRPGAGGGSVRTHEINRRLAERWDITAVCARYPGCAERVEDGVRYVHIGREWGYFGSLLTYFASIHLALRRYSADLVVEEFAAPFGSVGVPWATRRPVVGVVQWLFADQLKHKYHLPFPVIERLGLRSHRRLIGVSADLSAELRDRNPRAEVTTVRNGLDELAFADHRGPRAHALYLGRLDVAHKGLDLLLDAFAVVAPKVAGDLLLAGDGPDEPFLRSRVAALGLQTRVHFLGRIAAADRFALLARAQLVVMPSRYETFGMVAAEALAVGTPVLSFDIPCLGELTIDGTGVQVPAYDIEAYAAALLELLRDPERCASLGEGGPVSVKGLRWDDLALQQEDVYLDALAAQSSPVLASA